MFRLVEVVEVITTSLSSNWPTVQFASSSGRAVKGRERKYCETSRQRKRRQWKERQEQRTAERPPVFTDWMFLPDLVLEHIFKFLSYKVSGTRLEV